MADKELNIKIKLNSDVKAAGQVKTEIDGISTSLNTASSSVDTFYSKLRNTASVIASFVAIKETFGSAAISGFEYNKTIENLTNSLTILYAATSSNVSSTGRLLDIEQKQQLSRLEALETIKELERINANTPHTLNQTVEIYNAMLPSMRKAGVANKDLLDITEKLSIATKTIDFNQVLAGVDGLASGTVLANSELGRFLVPLGLTNEALKNTDDIVGLINEKLKDIQAIEDYSSIVSNLTNEYNKLTGAMTYEAFESTKELMKDTTAVLQDMNKNIPALKDSISTVAKLGSSVVVTVAAFKAWNLTTRAYNTLVATSTIRTNALGQVIQRNTIRTKLATAATRTFSKVLRLTPFGIATTAVYLLSNAFFDNSAKAQTLEDAYSDVSLKLEGLTKNQLEYKKSLIETELIQARLDLANAKADASNKGIFETNKEYLEDKAYADELSKRFKNLQKASRDVKDALANLGKESKKTNESINESLVASSSKDIEKIINIRGTAQEKFNLQLEKNIKLLKDAGDSQKQINAYRARETKAFNESQKKLSKTRSKENKQELTTSTSSWQKYFERVGDYEKAWLIKRAELRKEYVSLNKDEFTAIEQLEKNDYFNKKREVELEVKFKQIDQNSEEMLSILDTQQDLISNTNDWNSSLTGVAGAIGNVSTSFSKMSSNNIAMQKAEIKLNTQYEKDRLKYANNQDKLKKIELKHNKDLSSLKRKSFSNELNSYVQLSGAMQGLFKQGSKEAQAMQLVQAGLATYNAVNAVLTQGQGDPYSAPFRMAAMAASVAGLLANIGQTFNFGKLRESEHKDALTLMKENKGQGTVLGDSSKGSESIKNSLDILEDYAQPQFETLQSMNTYLQSIDAKMGGLSSLLIRGERFAQGDGFTASSSSRQLIQLPNYLNTAIGTGLIGTALEALNVPLLGDFASWVGGLVNSTLGGLFGRTSVSRRLHDSGLIFQAQNITDAIENIDGQAFQTVATTVTRKSWFRKSRKTTYNSYFQDLNYETQRQFELVLGGLYNTVLTSADTLDTATSKVEDELSDFVVDIGKISLKDKTGEEIQEQLSNIFSSIGDNLAKDAFPAIQEFQKVGEGLFETLTRVATGMEVAEFYINRLGNAYEDVRYTDIQNTNIDVAIAALTQSIEKYEQETYGLSNGVLKIVNNFQGTAAELYKTYSSLEEIRLKMAYTNQDSRNLGSDFIRGAGSIDALNSGLENYFESYLNNIERNTYKTQKLTKEFSKLGLDLPSSNEEFRSLVEGIDTSTKAGAELYGRVIILSKSFSELSDSLEDTKKSSQDFIKQSEKSLNDLVQANTNAFIKGLNSVGNLANSLSQNALNTINRLNSNNLSTTQRIKSFNNATDAFNNYFENGVLKQGLDEKEVNASYRQILDLASSLGSEDASLIPDINSVLEGNIQDFTKTEDVIKVNIVDGIAELVNANLSTKEQLKVIAADGIITNTELSSMTSLSQAQKDAILAVANNTSYVSTSTNQKSLEEFAKLQLEALRKQNEQETESLSSKTLKYGDTVGLQEQIDIAKLYGVQYSEVEPFIKDVQNLDVAKDKTASLSQYLGYKGNGSSTYDKVKFNQLKTLEPYLSTDITTALDAIEKEASFNSKVKVYETALEDAKLIYAKEKKESDTAKNAYDRAFESSVASKYDSYKNVKENIETGQVHYHEGYSYWLNKPHPHKVYFPVYDKQFKEARQAYLNLQNAEQALKDFKNKGYKNGGFTPNIGVNNIAGVVHGGEYVAPAHQVSQYPELFKHLDNSRTGYKSGGFVDFTMPSNNTNFKELVVQLQEVNKRLENLEKINTLHKNTSTKLKNEVEMKLNSIINEIGA